LKAVPKHNNMSLIIAATDFSEVGENAVNYACQLALGHQAELVIVHSYMVPVMFSDIPIPSPIINDTIHDAESHMDKLINRLKATYGGLPIKGMVLYGDIIDALAEYTEERNPWLVVVGNSNADGDNSWMDNALHSSFKKLKYPVLAIPHGYQYTPVHRLCFAFDNKHTGNDLALQQLLGISVALTAELHVLNVQADVHNQDNNPDIDAHAREVLSRARPKYHILFEHENIEAAIIDYVRDNQADWLILIPRKHSFFESIFHKSLTNSISHHLRIPIVALHDQHS
jgi:nucleotide-binding universal stress UspA family protein